MHEFRALPACSCCIQVEGCAKKSQKSVCGCRQYCKLHMRGMGLKPVVRQLSTRTPSSLINDLHCHVPFQWQAMGTSTVPTQP